MSDTVYTVDCELCGKPVDPLARETWQRCTGWARRGKAGGSDIAVREQREGWAHPYCVSKAQAGLHVGQGALL